MRLVPKPRLSYLHPQRPLRSGVPVLTGILCFVASSPAHAQAPAPPAEPELGDASSDEGPGPDRKAEADETDASGTEGEESGTAPTTNEEGSEEPLDAEDQSVTQTESAGEAEEIADPVGSEKPGSDEDGWMKLEASTAGLETKPPEPAPYFRTMLLVEGTARYGGVTIAPPGATIEDDDPDAFESRVGNVGGQVTLGVMPGGSVFTMAGRVRGGSYLSEEFTRGNMAAEMLFGANFARNARGNEFTHILGGIGVEFLPGENQDLLTLSLGAATVVKGVSFGGGILLGANDEVAIGTLGMQVGWGQLF